MEESVNNPSSFVVDYITAISRFSNVMKRFPVKNILYRTIFRGKGLEFDSFRKFEVDDDASFVDWKASLRAQELLARKYIEERDLHIYFIFDVSNSMLFGGKGKLKAEYAAEVILALSYLILESGDQVSLLMFNDDVVQFLPPGSGKRHFYKMLRLISDPQKYGGDYEIDKPIEYLLNTVNTDYNVFVLVSDFIKFHKTSKKVLSMLSFRYETLGIMIRDPYDEVLPDTKYQMVISDPYSNRQLLLDPELASDEYEQFALKQKEQLRQIFLTSNVDTLELSTGEDFCLPLASFLRRRSKGARI